LQTKFPVIVLSHPQMGENIGACARAMKNFGLSCLRIVNPRDGWPNPKALSNAVGAANIIEDAQIYSSLEDAIKDLEMVYGTTAVKRDMNKNHILSKSLPSNFEFDLKNGILFGRENCGLTNNEISLCNKIITIDTDKEFSSLNIAQAVLVICYEIFKPIERKDLGNIQEYASKHELEYFYDHLFNLLEKKNFFKVDEKKEIMQRNIINIFSRIEKLSKSEIQTLRGILKSFEL
jgi:tRNA/rRNA methyltransferase